MTTKWTVLLVLTLSTAAIAQEDSRDGDEGPPCSLPRKYPVRVLDDYMEPGETCPSELARSDTRESISNDIRNILRDAVEDCSMNMNDMCGGPGWRLRAVINASNPDNVCPSGFRFESDPPRCVTEGSDSGCTSAYYPGLHNDISPYEEVCGILFAYQYNAPNAFEPYNNNQSLTLDDLYVDGVSLTHGVPGERKHIWTWAAASSEFDSGPTVCPCTNDIDPDTIQIPPFVGMDYFCETGVIDTPEERWYTEDPLWEG